MPDDADPAPRRHWGRWTLVLLAAGAVLVAGAVNFLLAPRSDTDFVGVATTLCDELRPDRLSTVVGFPLTVSPAIPGASMHCTLEGPTPTGTAWIRFSMATNQNVEFPSIWAWNSDTSGMDGIGWKYAGEFGGTSGARIVSAFGNSSATVSITSQQSDFGNAALAVALLNEWLV
jgi:hypothetical protein